jgi:hypothetical protein
MVLTAKKDADYKESFDEVLPEMLDLGKTMVGA